MNPVFRCVLGPQYSEDSDSSSTNTLHIVHAHIIQETGGSLSCGGGPAMNTCGWHGLCRSVSLS